SGVFGKGGRHELRQLACRSTAILPPWDSITRLQMLRPRPYPPVLLERERSTRKNGSKTRSMSPSGIPTPSSVTRTITVSAFWVTEISTGRLVDSEYLAAF